MLLTAFKDYDTTVGGGLTIDGQNYDVHRFVLDVSERIAEIAGSTKRLSMVAAVMLRMARASPCARSLVPRARSLCLASSRSVFLS